MKEADGTSVLDNSMIVYGCGIGEGNRHNHDELPVVLGTEDNAVNGGRTMHQAFTEKGAKLIWSEDPLQVVPRRWCS